MELPTNFIYFDKNNANIFSKMIKEQGGEVCQNKMNQNYINIQSKKFDFGFAHILPVAQIGQKTRSKTASNRLSSFILCNLFPSFDHLEISLVCSKSNVKHGQILMDLVHQKAIELNYKYLFLLSLSEEKLVNWYKKQGFVVLSEKFHDSGELKAYAMLKNV
jgi:hypothetical protein